MKAYAKQGLGKYLGRLPVFYSSCKTDACNSEESAMRVYPVRHAIFSEQGKRIQKRLTNTGATTHASQKGT